MASSSSSNWLDYASPQTKYLVNLIESDPNPPLPTDIELIQYLKATTLNPYYRHVLATPLLVLSSVSVSCHDLSRFFGSNDNDIHIAIIVIDNDKQEFLLFDNNTCDDSDVLFFHDDKLNISLDKSKHNHPLWIPKFLKLKLLLEDRSTGFQKIDYCDLNLEPNVVYDKQHCLELRSDVYELVSVRFTYFRYATLALVNCRLEKIDDTSGTEHVYADFSGAISARFRIRDQIITRVLLNQQDENFEILDPAKLCWSLKLAVPAYSHLEILVDNLVINQEKIDTAGHNLKFEPHHNYKEVVKIEGQKWRLLVTVKWKHVYKSLPQLCECDFEGDARGSEGEVEFEELEESDSETSGQSSELIEASSQRRPEKRLRLQTMELPLTDMNVLMQRVKPLRSLGVYPNNLVEVFSISVCPYVDSLDGYFFLCGTISSCDSFGEHEVFNGDKNRACLLYPHQTISMVEQFRCYSDLNFSMRLDLKDNLGRELSRGYLVWCFVAASLWLDRRMCSIVRGNNGFAAVHYTLFSNASQARVAVSFCSNNRHPHRVYGRIRARYTGYRYSTQYDQKYYQSVFFQKCKDDYVTLHDGDSVPLSKLVISVPVDEALIVIANLKLVEEREEKLKGKVEFQAQVAYKSLVTSQPQSIEGHNCRLVVSVSWG